MNLGYEKEEIEALKEECQEEEMNFVLVEDDMDMGDSGEFAHFQFVGKHEGNEVIYDAVLYTLQLHHSSLLLEEAEKKVAKIHKDFVPIDERDASYVENEEADELVEEFIQEMEEEETIKVAEYYEVDLDFEYGIGLEIALNVEEITVEIISKFIEDFNSNSVVLDKNVYSFKHDEDEE
jgi:hypothetical protein